MDPAVVEVPQLALDPVHPALHLFNIGLKQRKRVRKGALTGFVFLEIALSSTTLGEMQENFRVDLRVFSKLMLLELLVFGMSTDEGPHHNGICCSGSS